MADKSLKFDIVANPEKALDALQEVAKATDKIEGETVTFTAEADVDRALDSIKALRDHLEGIAKVRPDLDVSGAVAGLDRLEAKAQAAGKNIRSATGDLGKGAIQSVGPLRDVSAAFGNVGVGALDAAEGVLGFSESLATVNPKFEKFFAIASRSAFIGGALAAGVIAATKALADFTGASTATADALKTLEIADKATESMEALAKALGSSAIQNGLRVIGSGGKDIEGFNDILKESPLAALQLIKVLQGAGEDVTTLVDQYEDYVVATASAAEESKQFAADVELVTKAQERGLDVAALGLAKTKELIAQFEFEEEVRRRNWEATEGQADAQGNLNDTTGDGAAQLDDYLSALEKLNDEIAERSGAILTEAESRVALADAQAAYNETAKEGKASSDELVVGAQELAEAYADVLEAQALANGESFTTTDRNNAIKNSLKATADQASGPTKKAILDVVDALDQVPSEVPTDLVVNNRQALQAINDTIRRLQILRDEASIMREIAAGRGAPLPPGVSSTGGGITQNITVNAGFGTDAFAVRSAVLASARQAARLAQGAVRFGT